MEEEMDQTKELIQVGAFVVIVVVILLVGIFAWHEWTVARQNKVVLHSGYTYTGPTPTGGAPAAPSTAGKFTAAADVKWKTIKGSVYPYMFDAPETLSLVQFPNDPYDIWAISWNNLLPQSNVLVGVDNLNNNPKVKEYVNQPKITYVENWWKQFGALSGVSAITPFTNKAGMKGYKAKYLINGNPAPTDDIFFEVPKRPELVIHLANGVLEQSVFDKILDSVAWDGVKKNK